MTVWILGGAKAIGPAGGRVLTPGGNVALTIPAGALATSTVIAIQPAVAAPGSSRLVGGTTLDLQPSGLAFAQPATLSVDVGAGSIPGGTRNEPALRLFLDSGGLWTEVAGSGFDPNTHTVSAPLTHFSTYGVLISLRGVSALTAGTDHACLVITTGQALCWGSNDHGQLGDGTTTASSVPVMVQGGGAFQSITAGGDFSCGVSTLGDGYCWGWNTAGQLGNGSASDATTPTAISGGLKFLEIEALEYSACGRAVGNVAYCWGSNGTGQVGAVSSDTCVFFQTPCAKQPLAVSGGQLFTSISGGLVAGCGTTSAGGSVCWGWNGFGQLGLPASTLQSAIPVPTPGGPHSLVWAGVAHSCGSTGGTIQCWGTNFFGNMGTGSTSVVSSLLPTSIIGGLSFATLDVGHADWLYAVSCGVTTLGLGYCWGANSNGGLGTSAPLASCAGGSPPAPPTFGCTGTPVPVSGGLTFQTIQVGGQFACGVAVPKQVWCWGLNTFGQVGDGTQVDASSPRQVQ